jgi:hypothetical protein
MDSTQDTVPLEDGQIPANRLGGDIKGFGKVVDVDSSGGSGTIEDVLLAFLCVHGVSRLVIGC